MIKVCHAPGFILLTEPGVGEFEVRLQISKILYYENRAGKTTVYLEGGVTFSVVETVEDIDAKIYAERIRRPQVEHQKHREAMDKLFASRKEARLAGEAESKAKAKKL